MTTDFRALCVELTDALDKLNCSFNVPNQSGLVERASAALAQPEPEVVGPTDAETEPAIEPVQPPGRNGMTWQQVIQGLRDVLADESEDAVQRVWQRSRICDAVNLMEANSAAELDPTTGTSGKDYSHDQPKTEE